MAVKGMWYVYVGMYSVWKEYYDSLPAVTAKLLGNRLQEIEVASYKLLVNSNIWKNTDFDIII